MPQKNRSDALTPDMFDAIARNTFGTSARITKIEKMRAGNDNQPYKITLSGHDQAYVFRFRMWRQDNYRKESDNYRRIHALTGIKVPVIYCIDRREKIAPTAYMVMDFLEGLEVDECRKTEADEEQVQEQSGRFMALIHQDKVTAEDPDFDVDLIKARLGFIEQAVKSGYIDIDRAILEKCEQAVLTEPLLRSDTQSFCINDTHLYFKRTDNGLELSFILDPEWAHYGTVQLDLWPKMAVEPRAWHRSQAVGFLSPAEALAMPFFRGYEQVASLDYERLNHVAPYYQLSIWGTIFHNHERDPDQSRQVAAIHSEEISILAGIVSSRA